MWYFNMCSVAKMMTESAYFAGTRFGELPNYDYDTDRTFAESRPQSGQIQLCSVHTVLYIQEVLFVTDFFAVCGSCALIFGPMLLQIYTQKLQC